jgi:hypothetical protein
MGMLSGPKLPKAVAPPPVATSLDPAILAARQRMIQQSKKYGRQAMMLTGPRGVSQSAQVGMHNLLAGSAALGRVGPGA